MSEVVKCLHILFLLLTLLTCSDAQSESEFQVKDKTTGNLEIHATRESAKVGFILFHFYLNPRCYNSSEGFFHYELQW